MTDHEANKAHFISLVERFTAERLSDRERKHSCCVAPAVGPLALARMFRAERLPSDPIALEDFAHKLTDWAVGLSPASECPYADEDLITTTY